MAKLFALSLIAAASALTPHKVEPPHQKPLLPEACPSNSILSNGVCQPPNPQHPAFQSNESLPLIKPSHPTQDPSDLLWDHWPECYANKLIKEPVCVFSHRSFASGRGIIIISSASKAHKMLLKPAFTDPSTLSRVNNHFNPPYELRSMPGKGRGLIANTTLHRGTQIFASTPLLLSDPDAFSLDESERLALSRRGIPQLPTASQSLFWSLLDHFKGDPIDDRINTNAFEIEIDSATHYAVLPEIAMMNHDCRPNAAYFWDESTLSHYVHATQTIYPGEEITITYINNERRRSKRVEMLRENWGFECGCAACSAHPVFVTESDARVRQIQELGKRLGEWTRDSDATPQMAETLISLYEQERMTGSLGVAYKHAAEAYASFGDRWNAIKYARLSAEYIMLDKGFEDREVKDMKAMAKDPEMAWSWKKRVGGKREGCGYGHAH